MPSIFLKECFTRGEIAELSHHWPPAAFHEGSSSAVPVQVGAMFPRHAAHHPPPNNHLKGNLLLHHLSLTEVTECALGNYWDDEPQTCNCLHQGYKSTGVERACTKKQAEPTPRGILTRIWSSKESLEDMMLKTVIYTGVLFLICNKVLARDDPLYSPYSSKDLANLKVRGRRNTGQN